MTTKKMVSEKTFSFLFFFFFKKGVSSLELGTQVASLEWLTTHEMMAYYFRSNREAPRGARI